MRIQGAVFSGFPPFADGSITFKTKPDASPLGEVQILTGENGTGKSRLLALLAGSLGNTKPLEQRGIIFNDQRLQVIATDNTSNAVWRGSSTTIVGKPFDIPNSASEIKKKMGHVHESGTDLTNSFRDKTVAIAFRGIAEMSDADVLPIAPIEGVKDIQLAFEHDLTDNKIILQSMCNLKMQTAIAMQEDPPNPNSRAVRLLRAIEGTISSITGRKFAFDIGITPKVNIQVKLDGTRMKFAHLPDGLRSIIGWLVKCVARLDALFPEHDDILSLPVIMLLDEPETHLHPAWQRKIIPAAQKLLSNAQFIVATHSPFLISSVNEGQLFVLKRNETGRVVIQESIKCSEGDTYIDVVEEVLGVQEWYDPETESMLNSFRELKSDVLIGKRPVEAALILAENIASRSDSLREIMARELQQLNMQLQRRGTAS